MKNIINKNQATPRKKLTYKESDDKQIIDDVDLDANIDIAPIYGLDKKFNITENGALLNSLANAIAYTVSLSGSFNDHYIFTDKTGNVGTLTLQKGQTYMFSRSDTGPTGHPFNLGDAWRSNTTAIPAISTGTDSTTVVNNINSIVNNNPIITESIIITIPSDYLGILKYYCYTHETMIDDFTIVCTVVLATKKSQILKSQLKILHCKRLHT